MPKINILDASVFNLISAGEVVERPASVVKELVENAIDAGSGEISIDVVDGGIKSIVVSDNGCGMAPQDLPYAFLPHATSKLTCAEDLDSIATLGFRGEALASIASVARVCLTSRTPDEELGAQFEIAGGKGGETIRVGCPSGTRIEVSDLFFNTPVRAKFLKKPKTEEGAVINVVSALMLANPDVRMKLYCDDKPTMQSGGGLEAALYAVYKSDTANDMLPFDCKFGATRIYGYTGAKSLYKHNRNFQTVIVNGRCVENSGVSAAVSQAYGNALMKRCYPVFVINIITPFDEVDVNVHPRKSEVRFRDVGNIFSYVYRTISSAINTEEDYLRPPSVDEKGEAAADLVPQTEPLRADDRLPKAAMLPSDTPDGGISREDLEKSLRRGQERVEAMGERRSVARFDEFEKRGSFVGDARVGRGRSSRLPDLTYGTLFDEAEEAFVDKYKIDGQVFETYLIVEYGGDAYVIDQHAVHEKLLFDELKAKVDGGEVLSQQLLMPYVFVCTAQQSEFILRIRDNISKLGFKIEEFGANTFKVSSIPTVLEDINLQVFFEELMDDMPSYNLKTSDLIVGRLAQHACKTAIKAGDKLSEKKIEMLIASMKDGIPMQCPHGRPAIIKFGRKDLDKLFKRIL